MITEHTIGEITLSISTVIYCIWLLPQIFLNYRCKNTDGLSLWMHGLLLLGYSADLSYGFGRHMQWQYRLVTIVGLIFLLVQHIQFARYGLKTKSIVLNYLFLTILVMIVFTYAISNFILADHGKQYYDMAGFISDLCWMTYLLPQLIKNYRLKSTAGLSMWFVFFALCLGVLDAISTFMLHWDWPSVLSVGITMLKKLILVFQVVYYRKLSVIRNP